MTLAAPGYEAVQKRPAVQGGGKRTCWTGLLGPAFPSPPHWAGRVKLLLTGFAKWVSPHGWATMAGRWASRQFPTQEPSMAPGC